MAVQEGIGMVARQVSHALSVALLAGLDGSAVRARRAGHRRGSPQSPGQRRRMAMYGRDYRNERFSPLDQITPDNVKELRPARRSRPAARLPGSRRRP